LLYSAQLDHSTKKLTVSSKSDNAFYSESHVYGETDIEWKKV